MNYQALAFFDLDGTLLDGQSKITPEIAQAMAQLIQNKVLPVIATGRTEAEIYEIRETAGITSNIVMNGAFIRVDGEIVYNETIDPKISERMINAVRDKKHSLSFYNPSNYWSTHHDDNTVNAYGHIKSRLPEINPLGYQDTDVNMLLVLSQDGDEDYHAAFPELTFYRNGPFSIDIVNRGTSKGTAIKRLQKIMNLEDVPTFGFGDGNNDFALLEACDNKIAMGNAVAGLKEMADFITKPNTDGGIIHALKHFDLI